MTKRRTNPLDIFLVFAFIAGVIGVCVRFYKSDARSAKSNDYARITFEIEGASMASVDAIKEGDTFYIKQNGIEIGRVIGDIELEKTKSIIEKDGEIFFAEQNDSYVIKGVLDSRGSFTEDGFFLSASYHIAPNMKIPISSVKLDTEVYILSIGTP